MMRPDEFLEIADDIIEGCPAAERFLREECNATTHRMTVFKAVKAGKLKTLNADEYGLHGNHNLFLKQDLVDWYQSWKGVLS